MEVHVPIYEYQCPGCSHKFEKIQSVSEKEKIACPKCGGRAERVLSPFSCGGGKETDSAAGSACGPAPGGRYS
ncbi:MAG TPA: zinc ribbon domain-containing protein [Thermodesulfobacteriota bacterium]|nr:zinc ribbon domain-containing protein [Thermodesulfobacteriota bacterium]